MPSRRPNLLFILSDDQGPWAMGCAGNAELRTPHLDAIAAAGTRFENFYCTSPVCSPARATIMTGRIPSQHGVHDWLRAGNSPSENEHAVIRYLEGETTWSQRLAEAGYLCALSGKWHLGDTHREQAGYRWWKAHARGGGNYYEAPMVLNETEIYDEPRYVTDVITDNALGFLEERGTSAQPWCLNVHYTAPHSPWERAQHPAEFFDPYFNDCPFESVPDEPEHPWSNQLRGFFSGRRREWLAGYYAAVSAMDAGIGKLLEWLDRRGLREDTLVVFTGDNGMNMGHHGVCGKGNSTAPLNLYESSVKVPCLVSQPGRIPEGQVRSELCSHYDWRATLCEWLDVDDQGCTGPGHSFAPLLRGEAAGQPERVVVYDEYGASRMIREGDRKYVHRYPDGPNEYYDLAADPDERSNRIDDPACAADVADLRDKLATWFDHYSEPRFDGAKLPAVCGKGQVNWADQPDAFPRGYEQLQHRSAKQMG